MRALKYKLFMTSIIVGTLLASCSSGEFAGSQNAAKKPEKDPKSAPAVATPTTSPIPVPKSTPDSDGEDKPATEPPSVVTGDGKDTRPTESVVFGGDQRFFRLGNGVIDSDTPCYNEVISAKLSGKTFTFSFDVLENSTSVAITIGKLCGLAYSNSSVRLFPTPFVGVPANLPVGPKSMSLGTQVLNKGSYMIEIKSGKRLLDYDDFLVGDIRLTYKAGAVKIGVARAQ